MRANHKFRPSGQWELEDRVALSCACASAAAEVAAKATPQQGLRATFRGRFAAVPSPGLGGPSQANLNGSGPLPGLGNARLVGTLTSNPALPPPASDTQGLIRITARRAGGTIVAIADGPTTDLASRTPSTTQLHFTIVSAPRRFLPLIGSEGTATLTLRPQPRNATPGGPVNGQFTLRVVQS